MDKQFILVAEVKDAAIPTNLGILAQTRLDFPLRIRWMVVGGKRQVYNLFIAPGKIKLLKEMLDTTGVYEKLELFEFVSF